jgi:hypothetical protein
MKVLVTGSADPATSSAPYRVYNIGNNNPVDLKTCSPERGRL